MLHQVALGAAGMPGEEVQHLEFHVGQFMRSVAKVAVLPGAVQVHDGVDGFEDVVGAIHGYTVDFIN
ncbi:hypothetical protein D3C78_1848690 [compost metagenome]